MNGAPLLSVQIAQDKAYTAISFGMATHEWFDFVKNDDPLLHGIIFLMTTKTSLVVALLSMGVALFLGLLISLPYWRAVRWRAGQPGDHRPSTEADPFLKKTIWTRRW